MEEEQLSKLSIMNHIRDKYQKLGEEKQVLLRRIGICFVIWKIVMSIMFIVIACLGLIDNIPWYMYGNPMYISITMIGPILIAYLHLRLLPYLSKKKQHSPFSQELITTYV